MFHWNIAFLIQHHVGKHAEMRYHINIIKDGLVSDELYYQGKKNMKEFYEREWKRNLISHWSKKEIDKIIKIIRPYLKNSCLDVGCGYGEITNELNKIVPTQGIDISSIVIKKSIKNYPHIQFKQGSATDIPFPDNSFNTIFTGELIEHVPDTSKMFSEFRRILKQGGSLIIITPEFSFIKNLIISLFYWEDFYNPLGEHLRFYSKKRLKEILKDNSFKPIFEWRKKHFGIIPNLMLITAEAI